MTSCPSLARPASLKSRCSPGCADLPDSGRYRGKRRTQGGRVEVIPVVLITGVLLFDTGFTLIRRARSGQNLVAAHREHLYQRLVEAGRSHREVSVGYALATVAMGLAALAWIHLPIAAQVAIIVATAMAGVVYARRVAIEERHAAGR